MSEEAGGQDEVMGFLADPANWGTGGETVRRIDTHAASVFLSGDRALKIKRAVRFPFLDYATLDKRKAACDAELAVNAPYAPEIYRGVVAITREPGGRLAIAGRGAPVEWAVDMRRFDEAHTLDRVVEAIDDALADALGRAVAAAHERAAVVEAAEWIAALERYIDQNIGAFRKRPDLFAPDAVTALERQARASYARIRPLLETRGRQGRVRRCHGDLHLGNIALIEGRPVLFDAIEFNPLIATGDIFYDLAFLLMDLCERGLVRAANIVLNCYLIETRRVEDLDGLATLPFFMMLRAAIRAMVTAARGERALAAERAAIDGAAKPYFAFAGRALAPVEPQVLATGGLSGSGKSQLARSLAPHIPPLPGAVILRSDVERKALYGCRETDALPADAYRPEVSGQVYALLNDKARRIAGAGHSAIIDAVFARPEERAAAEAAAKAAGVSFHGLFLAADLATRLARVGGRTGDASDADRAVAQAQEDYDMGAMEWTVIDASGGVAETLAQALAALG